MGYGNQIMETKKKGMLPLHDAERLPWQLIITGTYRGPFLLAALAALIMMDLMQSARYCSSCEAQWLRMEQVRRSLVSTFRLSRGFRYSWDALQHRQRGDGQYDQ